MSRKRIDVKEKIIQRSVGFKYRQMEFLSKYPDFKPDIYCREALDEQIKLIDSNFLENGNN